jgi:hypothetical protein
MADPYLETAVKSVAQYRHQIEELKSKQQIFINPMFFRPENMGKLSDFLRSTLHKEVEASLGKWNGRTFFPGVTRDQFYFILTQLLEMSPVVFLKKETVASEEFRIRNLRKIVFGDGPPIFQKKQSEQVVDVPEWGYRIKMASEENITPTKYEERMLDFTIPKPVDVQQERVYRNKIRHTFMAIDTSEFQGIKIDLTYVTQTTGQAVKDIYEVEIERQSSGIASERFLNIVKFVLMLSQQLSPYNPTTKKIERIGEQFKGEKWLMSIGEIDMIARYYNTLFSFDIHRRQVNLKPGCFFEFKNKPKAINTRVFYNSNDYAMTVKYDGVRKFLYASSYGIYLINPKFDIRKIAEPVESLVGTLIDGELMTGKPFEIPTYFAFDILFYIGQDVRRYNLEERLKILGEKTLVGIQSELLNYKLKPFYIGGSPAFNNIAGNVTFTEIKDMNKYLIISPSAKTEKPKKLIHTDTSFYYKAAELVDAAQTRDEKKGIPIDGWIFQPRYQPYRNENTWKWKPADLLTIDFYVEHAEDNTYTLYVKSKTDKYMVFRGTESLPFSGRTTIDDPAYPSTAIDGQIVEMRWGGGRFVPFRVRPDRNQPNFEDWAVDLWKSIHNPMPKSTLLGKDLRLARAWLNDKKGEFIKVYVRPKLEKAKEKIIMDIGSGRGGDLSKWKRMGLTVYIIEPNTNNLKELIRRQTTLKYPQDNVLILNTEAENTEKIIEQIRKRAQKLKKSEWRAEAITMFFCSHFFETEEKLKKLANTLNEVLLPNGVLIGINMDGSEVKKLMEVNSTSTLEYEGWSITKLGEGWDTTLNKNEIIVNIDDPTSMVQKQTEFLFDFEAFHEALDSVSITLQETGFYKNDPSFPLTNQTWISLHRYFVFRKVEKEKVIYPPLYVLSPGKTQKIASPYGPLYRVGTIGDGSCFFHAILEAFDKSYKALSQEEKIKFVAKFRVSLAQHLTFKEYEKLGNGSIAEYYTAVYGERSKDKKNAATLGWAYYLKKLSSSTEWVGEDLQVTEFVSNIIGIDVYILQDRLRDIYMFAPDCKSMFKNRPSIVLLNVDNIHYETIGIMGKDGVIRTLFPPTNSFIKSLYNKVCSK